MKSHALSFAILFSVIPPLTSSFWTDTFTPINGPSGLAAAAATEIVSGGSSQAKGEQFNEAH